MPTAKFQCQPTKFDCFSLSPRLCGYSEWSSEIISVYVNDTAAAEQNDGCLKNALAEHLFALVSHVFLHCKPARPSQSRWTGVASVAQWALGLFLFHRMLQPLFVALASGNTADEGAVMDADVTASGNDSDSDSDSDIVLRGKSFWLTRRFD